MTTQVTSNPERGFANVNVSLTKDVAIDKEAVESLLCSDCLSAITDEYRNEPYGVGVIDFDTHEVRLLEEKITGFTFGDYYIDIDSKEKEKSSDPRNISFHLTTLYIGTWDFATMSTLCKTTRNVGAFVEVSYSSLDYIKKAQLHVTTKVEDGTNQIGYCLAGDGSSTTLQNEYFDEKTEKADKAREEARILYVAMTRAIRSFSWIEMEGKRNLSWQNLIEKEE